MKPPDPLMLKYALPKSVVLFAASQLSGERETQEDYFLNFNDECFVLADGVGGLPHGEVASKLACETAIWGYKLIRQRRFYWLDKKLLVRRMFRSTNRTVWHKQRDVGYEAGLATTLEGVVIGDRNFYLGHVGDSSSWLYQNGVLKKITTDDMDGQGHLAKAIGMERYGFTPQVVAGKFVPGDTLLMLTDGVTGVLSHNDIHACVDTAGETLQSISDGVIALLKRAESSGSTDNMTAMMIKRVIYTA